MLFICSNIAIFNAALQGAGFWICSSITKASTIIFIFFLLGSILLALW
jgi:hypothetical protein